MRANQEQYDYEVHQKSRRRLVFSALLLDVSRNGFRKGDARVASASLLEFISMKQSGARGFFLSRLKVGINVGQM
jgi:hypothetical protein